MMVSVAANALDRLRRALDAGEWRPGERLPAERELARLLNVGRSSLRTALAELEAEGRIWRHVGQGTFVSHKSAAELSATLRLVPPPGPADVMELRQMIEPQIAATAALRATPPDLDRLRALAERGRSARDWADWETADGAFHAELARATRNPLLTAVLDTLHAIRNDREWQSRRKATLTEDRRKLYVDQHMQLLDAVSGRDPEAAASAMRRHLQTVEGAMVGHRPGATDTRDREPVA